ncbi:MAG: NYN domain-containing protein [Burkholderiaceae bacterium]
MTTERVMLLIDADNLSADVVEQAVAWVGKHFGGPHVRRAYCTAECALKDQALFKRLSIRPMVNLAAGKNSTDIALAVDAIDLAISERPAVVVIASSDSDFAPLVSRLREKGCRVVGIGQEGKTGEETKGVYDDYEVLTHKPRSSSPAPAAKAPAAKAPAKRPAAKRAATSRPAAKKAVAAAPPLPAPRDDLNAQVQDILRAVPALAKGDNLELNVVAARLRELKLLSKNASSTKLFLQYPQLFVLEPANKPHKVRAIRPLAVSTL